MAATISTDWPKDLNSISAGAYPATAIDHSRAKLIVDHFQLEQFAN